MKSKIKAENARAIAAGSDSKEIVELYDSVVKAINDAAEAGLYEVELMHSSVGTPLMSAVAQQLRTDGFSCVSLGSKTMTILWNKY